jgi:hypothetical protein
VLDASLKKYWKLWHVETKTNIFKVIPSEVKIETYNLYGAYQYENDLESSFG